jgi:DnaK suppressor protein
MPAKKTLKKTVVKLKKKDMKLFKELLEKLRKDMVHDINNMRENPNSDSDSRDLSGHAQHMADVATDMYDKEFNLGLAAHDREVLDKINEALMRIEKGTYGVCLGTGNNINRERLEAIPYAKYCLEHQEEIEKQQ